MTDDPRFTSRPYRRPSDAEDRHPVAAVVVLDPESGTVVRTVRLPSDSPYGIDHAQGGVFVALHDGELLRIDPRDESTERVRLGNGLTQLLATNEAVSVSADPCAGNVWKLDPRDGAVAGATPDASGKPVAGTETSRLPDARQRA